MFVQNKKVDISPHTYNNYYGVPYYESEELSALDLEKINNVDMDVILAYLTKGWGEWKSEGYKNYLLSLKQAIMLSVAKLWMHFIYTRISPLFHTNTVNVFRVAPLHCILQKKRVYIGRWINKEIKKCMLRIKFGIYFPHLITNLCCRAGVDMDPTEQFHHPTQT